MFKMIRRGLCLLTVLGLLPGSVLAVETDGRAAESVTAAAQAAHTAEEASEPEFDGYLVKMSDSASLQSAGKALRRSGVYAQLKEVSTGLYHTESRTAAERLVRSGDAEYMEPNYIITLDELPDDEYLVSGKQWYYNLLGIDGCWRRGLTGKGVRVGVIDSGISADHEDLQGANIVPGTNYTVGESSEKRFDTTDTNGHGTFVSGLIASVAGNGIGIAGLSPKVELVPLKGFEGKSSSLRNLIAAINGGVNDYHCQVLNMSLGVTNPSPSLQAAIENAVDAGVIVVAAVGNLEGTSTGNDQVMYPAAYPNTISVGAVDKDLTVASYSRQNQTVWICAPGSNLWSPSHSNTARYKEGKGTSYAAPIVTASVALALSVRPDLTVGQVQELMRLTARDLGEPGYDYAYGHGLLNTGLMMATLLGDVAWQSSCRAAEYTDEELVFLTGYDAQGNMQHVQLFNTGTASDGTEVPGASGEDTETEPSGGDENQPDKSDTGTDSPETDGAETDAPASADTGTDSQNKPTPLPDAAQWKLIVLMRETLKPLRDAFSLNNMPWA